MYDLNSDCKRQYLAWFALSTIMCYDEMTFKMLQKELNSDGRENKSIPP